MKKVVIIFASMSGNTEKMANYIAEGMYKENAEVEVIDIFDKHNSIESFDFENYDGIMIGSYTWMDGEVPDEFLDFYEDLPYYDLTGKKAAVFGSYDSLYGNDGVAVDLFVEALKEANAEMILSPLKVELSPEPDTVDNCRNYGVKFINRVSEKSNLRKQPL